MPKRAASTAFLRLLLAAAVTLLAANPMHDEIRYRILKQLEARPEISQRELAQVLGVSLGRANYCLRALIEKGLIKVDNFRRNDNKLAYAYLLTPAGLADKVKVTQRFLQRKLAEYDVLKAEIQTLRSEAQAIDLALQSPKTIRPGQR